MKRINVILALIVGLLLLFSVNFVSAKNSADYYKIIKIIDGDTFYIDFNNDGFPQKEEKVRINGIDAFEVKPSEYSDYQAKEFNLTKGEVLGLGYLGKEFAKKNLLNKYVRAEYTGETQTCDMGRKLMSIYYSNGKNYEQEILKAGFARVYKKSNLAQQLQKYENIAKIKANTQKTRGLDLVILNKKNNSYHKVTCEYGQMVGNAELIRKPISKKYKPAACCFEVTQKPPKKHLFLYANPDVSSKNLKVYYIDGFKYKKPSKKCRTSASKTLLKEIINAKKSICFAIYGIGGQPDIFEALVEAQKRGVNVRGATDMTQNNKNIYSDTDRLIRILKTITNDYQIADKNVKDDFDQVFDITAAIMHDKFFVFDEQKVFTGSANISDSCTGGYNTNVSVLINSPEIAQLYTQEFEQMYDLKFHTIKKEIQNNTNIKIDNNTIVSVYFSPKNKVFRTDLHDLLANAKKTIYVEMFYLTNKYLINDLIEAKNRGVDVKIILDASSTANDFSRQEQLKNAGIPVKIENWGGKMHTKGASIDNTYYVIGSMNWTGKAELHNDENLLIIKNPQIAQNTTKHFIKIWNIIPDRYLSIIPKPEGPESIGSCCDGLDNDHDGKTDSDDEDCRCTQNHK